MGTATDTYLVQDNAPNYEDSMYKGVTTAPVIDLRTGGQEGFMVNPSEFVAAARYVPGNIVCILVEAPAGFQKMTFNTERVATLKSLVEEQARTVEGLNSTLTVEMNETPIGGAGEMHQDITNVTRARSAPTFMWPEKLGRAISLFLEDWILQLGMDPETKVPTVINYSTEVTQKDFLPSFRTMTCLFFEPDPSFRTVVKAWLSTNMFPLTGGENVGARDLGTAGAPLEHSVEFSATTQIGVSVTNFAQTILDDMNLTNVNPYHQPAFVDSISADVASASTGFLEGLKSA